MISVFSPHDETGKAWLALDGAKDVPSIRSRLMDLRDAASRRLTDLYREEAKKSGIDLKLSDTGSFDASVPDSFSIRDLEASPTAHDDLARMMRFVGMRNSETSPEGRGLVVLLLLLRKAETAISGEMARHIPELVENGWVGTIENPTSGGTEPSTQERELIQATLNWFDSNVRTGDAPLAHAWTEFAGAEGIVPLKNALIALKGVAEAELAQSLVETAAALGLNLVAADLPKSGSKRSSPRRLRFHAP
jgi:hypothetical protein